VESIARELARLGRRVVISKANAQGGQDIAGAGLIQLLREEVAYQEILPSPVPLEPVRILLGESNPRPNLPALAKMRDLLLVIVDGAPLLSCADSEYFVTICDATIVAARAGKVTRTQLKTASTLMQRLHAAKVGFVISRKVISKDEKPDGMLEQPEVRARSFIPVWNQS
jgi:Mrp family chromosome partitioning ATPase